MTMSHSYLWQANASKMHDRMVIRLMLTTVRCVQVRSPGTPVNFKLGPKRFESSTRYSGPIRKIALLEIPTARPGAKPGPSPHKSLSKSSMQGAVLIDDTNRN